MQNAHQIRQDITAKLVAALESGVCPWRRPWNALRNSGRSANATSGRGYNGINPLLLDLHATRHGHSSRWWATFEQWKQLGGMVKKRPEQVAPGEWGAKIVLFRPATKAVEGDGDGPEEKNFLLMKTWTVFNADQVAGEAVERFRSEFSEEVRFPKYDAAEELIEATEAEIQFGGERSFYARPVGAWPEHTAGDYIRLPHRSQFVNVTGYYETILHELAHWSEVRLGWDHAQHGYAMGELVAEVASCYLANEIGIPQGTDLANHASYLGSWLKAMKEDPTFIFKACTQASKVADFLMKFAGCSVPQLTD